MMGLLDGLDRQFIRQMPCIFYFNPVIIDSDTHRTARIMELSVTKGIRQGFTQSLSGNFQFFLSRKAYYFFR